MFCCVRYVGDMLAWLHQTTASEKEHLEALLKQTTGQGTLSVTLINKVWLSTLPWIPKIK